MDQLPCDVMQTHVCCSPQLEDNWEDRGCARRQAVLSRCSTVAPGDLARHGAACI